jgi:hypothetical protein
MQVNKHVTLLYLKVEKNTDSDLLLHLKIVNASLLLMNARIFWHYM